MQLIIPQKIKFSSLFFFLVVLLLPVVDNLTGALFKLNIISEGGIGSPSQLARFASFGFVVWLLNRESQPQIIKSILIACCYLLSIEVLIACLHMNLKAFLTGLVFSIKILFALCCFYYVSHWVNHDTDRTKYVINKIIQYGTVVALLVLTAYLSGFHISNYKIGIATRGLFISGNGLGVVLGVSTIFAVYFNKKINLLKLGHIFLLLVSTALLGTKASMIFLVVALLLLILKLAQQSPILTTIVIATISIYLLIPIIDLLSDLFANIIYKYNNIDNKLTLFASSRDLFIKNAFNEINFDSFYSLRFLFGGGAYYAYTDFMVGNELLRKRLENDLFELFFAYGIIAASFYIGMFFYALKCCFTKRNIMIAIPLSLIFLHSITVGHVLFNGTSAISYALCLAIAIKGARVSQNDF